MPPSLAETTPLPAAPTTLPPLPQIKKDIAADIANILQEAKLPERQDAAAATQHPSLSATPTGATPSRAEVQMQPAMATPVSAASLPPERLVAADLTDKPQPTDRSPVVSLHTMKTDLQDVVRQDKMSLVRAASMEAERHKEAPTVAVKPPRNWRTIGLLASGSLVLLGLGGAALLGVYYVQTQNATAGAPSPIGIIFAEQKIAVTLNVPLGNSLNGIMQEAGGSVGAIIAIEPVVTEVAGTRNAQIGEFFAALGARPPEELVRALSGEFFFGIHIADMPSAVFIIPVSSYEHAFAGMLAWEKTINSDLSLLYKRAPQYVPAQEGQLPTERTFKDLVMRNYDVRALRDDAGATVMYYSFPTPALLVIAASPYTFPEVLSRLQAQRRL